MGGIEPLSTEGLWMLAGGALVLGVIFFTMAYYTIKAYREKNENNHVD